MKIWGSVLAYGMSEFKLADRLSIKPEEAKVIIDNYFNAVPKVKEFLDKLAEYGVKNRYIRSYKPYSIVRLLTDFNMEDNKQRGAAERRSKNTPIQATGAQMAKIAMYRLREVIKTLDYKVEMFLQVHDAIFCYVEEFRAEEWAKLQGEIMKEAGEIFIKDIPVLSDITITDQWSK